MIPKIVKIVIALSMALFLLHLPTIPTSAPEIQVVTVTIIHEEAQQCCH